MYKRARLINGKFFRILYPSPTTYLFFFWLIWYFSNLVTIAFYFADYKTRDCFPQLVTAYLQNKINIESINNPSVAFWPTPQSFELYHSGKTWVFSLMNCTLNSQKKMTFQTFLSGLWKKDGYLKTFFHILYPISCYHKDKKRFHLQVPLWERPVLTYLKEMFEESV